MDEPSPRRIAPKPLQAGRKSAKKLDGGLSPATSGTSDQGLRLGRAFASIKDPALRHSIVVLVEAMSKTPQ